MGTTPATRSCALSVGSSANVRRDSLVARVGGDEFGLLLPEACPRYAAGIASRLCELLASRPLVVRGRPEIIDRIKLSIGVAG
jgi:GGDEF domain-containing protein